jgi:hypothetical protein
MHSNVSIHMYPDTVVQSETLGEGGEAFEIVRIKDPTFFHGHGIDLMFSDDAIATIDRLITGLTEARARVLERSAIPA